MNIEKIVIPCSGYEIVTDWYSAPSDKNILVTLPGYSSTRTRQKDLVSAICNATGFSALVIDYSGHGDSPFALRDTRPAQHLLEVVAAFDWVTSAFPESAVSVMGSSYGGFLAAHLTQYREFERLVLRAPAIYRAEALYDLWSIRIDNPDIYDEQIHMFRSDTQALSKHPLFMQASDFAGRVLVAVHGQDELIPKQTTDTFIKAFDADSFTAQDFVHGIGDLAVESPAIAQALKKYEQKIAHWLQS